MTWYHGNILIYVFVLGNLLQDETASHERNVHRDEKEKDTDPDVVDNDVFNENAEFQIRTTTRAPQATSASSKEAVVVDELETPVHNSAGKAEGVAKALHEAYEWGSNMTSLPLAQRLELLEGRRQQLRECDLASDDKACAEWFCLITALDMCTIATVQANAAAAADSSRGEVTTTTDSEDIHPKLASSTQGSKIKKQKQTNVQTPTKKESCKKSKKLDADSIHGHDTSICTLCPPMCSCLRCMVKHSVSEVRVYKYCH